MAAPNILNATSIYRKKCRYALTTDAIDNANSSVIAHLIYQPTKLLR